ncbi:MAG: hypothetical protein K8T26_07785 [Lentisphaerae bacterium]|nr:hypothetical protein [Lentisphaerota bacterium]
MTRWAIARIAALAALVPMAAVWAEPVRAGGDAPTNAWSCIVAARAQAAPLCDAGRYREAASLYRGVQMRTRDKQVKAYARYAYDLCQLRDKIAKGRPGNDVVSLEFDDGVIPATFRDGRENLAIESRVTFAGSPGALRILRPTGDGFLLAESYSSFPVEPDTLLTVCIYAHNLNEAKFQLNTSKGNVHYFGKKAIENDAWSVVTFRLALDGSMQLPLGADVGTVAFVAHAAQKDAFVVLDEWHVIAHP